MPIVLTELFAALNQAGRRGLGAPILLTVMLAMMVIPMAPLLLDLFFTFNIAMSIIILLAVVYALRPLELSAFPSMLLIVTLLRLALNVASTRVVLLEGHTGPGAAGRVIEAFGAFVVGGNYAVGLVVFVILTIINFVVVTKGAERISEVSARFTLDAMPGKQMAIDADLNAGLLTRDEARARRDEIRHEADFYGSMDGASKFVRGDALAGVLILLINIVGGLIVGTAQHGLPLAEAMHNYTLLTIGDGLVAQLPSLMLSSSVAILVTRMSKSQDMGDQVIGQLFGSPKALALAGAMLTGVGFVPGMPNAVFLFLGLSCGALAWYQFHRANRGRTRAVEAEPESAAQPRDLDWDDVVPEDPIGLEVGYRLIPLVDERQGGQLMGRIKGVRKKLTHELGFLVQAVHIRDNLELAPNAYRLTIFGSVVGSGQVHADREMALSPGHVHGPLEGIKTMDPAFGLEAWWIDPAERAKAQGLGYTVVDAATVVATHLSQVIKDHAHELLGHDEVQHLLDGLARVTPKLVEDLVPGKLSLSVVVRVLQSLLAEKIPVRNLRSIAEALAEAASKSQDPAILVGDVRIALGRQIVQEINGLDEELPVLTLASTLEQMLQESLHGQSAVLEPGLADDLHKSIAEGVQRQEAAGQPAVLLVPAHLRAVLARFTRSTLPSLHVLAYNEVPESKRIRLVGALGGQP